ncbi:CLUMA_CG014587, isoform A [Clunio marinus]|uniref:CLUMA_CG014587, isoform A n=1 Tax=Clunio marinus TaxID=568069 RepID=A0A1J1INH0_9DIPT|nr:CLUMA_CG014587, isoform A [Clunio marinus]
MLPNLRYVLRTLRIIISTRVIGNVWKFLTISPIAIVWKAKPTAKAKRQFKTAGDLINVQLPVLLTLRAVCGSDRNLSSFENKNVIDN